MPKAATPSPMDWAGVQMAGGGFDINELNQVVRDYAYIELELAARERRRSPLERVIAKALTWVAVIGLIAAGVSLAAVFGARPSIAVVAFVWVACALGAFSVLHFYLPWRRMPYRQSDRTVSAISIMTFIIAAGMVVAIPVVHMDDEPLWWLMMVPAVVLLVVATGAIVGHSRFRSDSAPPAIDFGRLSPEDEQVLLESRRRALLRLRARMVVSYDDFAKFEKAPLGSFADGGV